MLLTVTAAMRIFLAMTLVDCRRSFDGLAAHVQEVLQQQVQEKGGER